ncbi:hypothetical protein AAFF_G00295450 [Aldrovandia affinis]|uniref:Uncharacterized protein n=1 Tax=Aldrovandia affinis TaxID=143900 RepID=A0AAD7W1A5_9TELE|nr:hypothetical protein AAFF_G00295450 [Aldrovandia affinis]
MRCRSFVSTSLCYKMVSIVVFVPLSSCPCTCCDILAPVFVKYAQRRKCRDLCSRESWGRNHDANQSPPLLSAAPSFLVFYVLVCVK